MKAITKLCDKLAELIDLCDAIYEELEEKQNAIEDRACERESGEMTDKEQEKYDQYDEIKDALEEAKESIESAKDALWEWDMN